MFSTPETLPLVFTPHIADHCREPLVAGVDALNLRAFLEKDADVVAKGTRESNRATRVGETVESIELGYSLPLLAGFKDWY